MKPLVVNLFGAPGSGKSTGAAYIFSKLKMKGICTCELVTEFAKDLVWENSSSINDQIYVFAEQYHRIQRLLKTTDVIITDSPLLLSLIYGNIQSELLRKAFESLVVEASNSFFHFDYNITRIKPYVKTGRLQTEQESDEIQNKINTMLDKYCSFYVERKGIQSEYDLIVDEIIDFGLL